MRMNGWKFLTTLSASLIAGLFFGLAQAQHESHHAHYENGTHGGVTASAQGHQFEVVFEPDGLRVYPLDLPASGLKGRAYFLMPGAKGYSAPYTLQAMAPAPGLPADALGVNADLSRVPTSGTKVTIQVWPLPEDPKAHAQFSLPFCAERHGNDHRRSIDAGRPGGDPDAEGLPDQPQAAGRDGRAGQGGAGGPGSLPLLPRVRADGSGRAGEVPHDGLDDCLGHPGRPEDHRRAAASARSAARNWARWERR